MYTNNRDAYRQAFFNAWQKHLKKLPLEPVEAQLIEMILMHPEYQPFLEIPQAYQAQEFTLEENPFVHMSLHLAVHEQIHIDRPMGVKEIYQSLVTKCNNDHDALHIMMQCLANIIWEAQQTGVIPDEAEYLLRLRRSL